MGEERGKVGDNAVDRAVPRWITDPAAGVLNVRCHGTSGCAHAGADPPVEDEFSVPL